MNSNRPIFSEQKPRFSRFSLNVIIIVTMLMIVLFSQSNRIMDSGQGELEALGAKQAPSTTAIDNDNSISTETEQNVAQKTEPEPEPDSITPATTEDESTNKATDKPVSVAHADQSTTENSSSSSNSEEKRQLETLSEIPLTVPPAKTAPIEHWISSKGAKVYFSAAPGIPMIDIRLIFSAGASQEIPEYAGIAKLTNGLLSEGSKHHTVDEIATHFEGLGADFNTSAYRDMALVSLRSLTDTSYLTPALQMFAEVINEPAFPEDALQRNLELMQLGLKHEKQRPGAIASKAFMQELYPAHPYGHHPSGTEESLNLIKQSDLFKFHSKYYVAKNATIAIVGAISKEQAAEIAETITAKMAIGEATQALPSAPPATARHEHIEFASQQTHIILGLPSLKRGDPIHPYLYIANDIFGGSGFNSILLTEIRENRGLSYSAGSGYSGMQAEGPFTIRLQTKNQSAQEALEVTYDELNKFIKNGPTTEQLETSKNNILASSPLQLANNERIVGHLGSIGFYNLPLDYLDGFYKKIAEATTEDVHKAFKEIVKTESLLTITLGPNNPSEAQEGSNKEESTKEKQSDTSD